MSALGLTVEVPVCSLRDPFAREYLDSFTAPPPSTVYGMLLSLVGEERRARHAGAALALAVLREPAQSTVLRTTWRFKTAGIPPGQGNNKKPDYQVVLTGLAFAVFVAPGHEQGPEPTLEARLREALATPERVQRHGGLSFGESRDLVDSVQRVRLAPEVEVTWLVPREDGELALPLWPDHVSGKRTRWVRLGRLRAPLTEPPPERFVVVEP